MKFLIVGAGAIGLPLASFLLKSHEVTLFVRQKRVAELEDSPQILYSYDKKELLEVTGYNVTSNPKDELIGAVDFIIITLPGSVLHSEEGKKLVRTLAETASDKAIFLSLAPGFGMVENVYKPSGVPEDRVLFALPVFLSHDVPMPGQPSYEQHPKLKEAKFGFHMLVSQSRPFMFCRATNSSMKSFTKALKKAKLYPISIPSSILEPMTAVMLMLTLISQKQNFPEKLKTSTEDFKIGMRAVRQVFSIHGGFIGTILRWTMGSFVMRIVDYSNRVQSKPISAAAFNRFHHGSKVLEQNIGHFELYISKGNELGKSTKHIEEFVSMCNKM